MKSTLLLPTLILLAACASGPISERIANKTAAEQNAYLLNECEDESLRGHDVGDHYHYSHRPENEAHAENMKKICKELTQPAMNKAALIQQCKTEAASGTYGGKFVFAKHVQSLTEICGGFALVK